MPTNLLRRGFRSAAVSKPGVRETPTAQPRIALVKARTLVVRIQLAQTPTADRLWQQMPLHSTIETWGNSVHFETHVETGRDRTARLNIGPRDVAFWSEDDRVILAWGPTPISRPDEIRLMRPCNIWAQALDDVSVLAELTPGECVMLARQP
jgi:uncharacterized protein